MDLQQLSIKLSEYEAEGSNFEAFFIPTNQQQEVLQVIVDHNDELPIFVTVTAEQMLCICYLFHESEIQEEVINELNRNLLQLNVPIPLSSFAMVEEQYVIFGALSSQSNLDDIAHELITLNDNAVEALESIESFLK